jgi:hypothetical protein
MAENILGPGHNQHKFWENIFTAAGHTAGGTLPSSTYAVSE